MSTVLVVDDDPGITEAIEAVLHAHHYCVLCVNSGRRALELACARLPDVVITDRDMPGMDGVKLCAELRRYPASARIPVIMISGRPWPPGRPSVWTIYMQKPVSGPALETAVRSVVQQRRSRNPGATLNSGQTSSRWEPFHRKNWF